MSLFLHNYLFDITRKEVPLGWKIATSIGINQDSKAMPPYHQAPEHWARLRRIGWEELWTRCRQELAKRWDVALHRVGIQVPTPILASSPAPQAQFFFAPNELAEILRLLRECLPDEAELIVQRADRICRHRFDLLGYQGLDYGAEIDWHLDAVHRKRAPRKPWYQINYLDFDEVGDSKVTWELNRHQHLVILAKAARLTQDNRYATELFRQWYHWQQANPYPIGINWASSLEVSFRSLSWLWVRHLLAGYTDVPREFSAGLIQALARNGRHIECYLSRYFSPNTHLLGEAVALFFIGTLCPQIQSAPRWQKCGWQIILQEAKRQVQGDGMHFEQSTYYHVYALDLFIHARMLAASNRVPIPAEYDRTLESMLEVLYSLSQAGVVPRLGDDDGGRVFDPQRNRVKHLLDPLCTGAALFRRADFKAAAGGLREETLWLLGPAGVRQFDELPTTSRPLKSVALETSGTYVLTNGDPIPQQLVVRAGPMGALSAGHSHADALSIHLAAGGRELLIDPGTFTYTSDQAHRNSFRGTAAHNTLQADGTDQAEAGSPFSWISRPAVRAERWVAGETFDLFAGSHTGYVRLLPPLLHRRWVFHRKSRFWLVRDLAIGEGIHQLDLYWHLAPGLLSEKWGKSASLFFSGRDGLAVLTPEGHDWSHTTELRPWSPAYGRKEQALVLHLEKRSRLPAEFATLLVPAAEGPPDLGILERLSDDPQNPALRVYRYTTRQESHWVFFAEGAGNWKAAGWESDAEFLYCELSRDGDLCHLVLSQGSFVSRAGQPMAAAKRTVMRFEWCGAGGTTRAFCSDEAALEHLAGNAAGSGEPALPPEESQRGVEGAC